VANATYSWWTQPLAVSDGSYTWVGSIARLGTVRIARVEPGTGAVQWATLGRSVADDHNAPSIALLRDQPHLLAFYTQHGNDSAMRYRTVDRATLALGPEQELTFSGPLTYAQIVQTSRTLILITRVGTSSWRYRSSDDLGVTWSDERVLIDAEGHGKVYALVKPIGTTGLRAHLVFYGHPVGSTYRPVEYGTIDLETGTISRPDGAVVGDLDEPGGPAIQPAELQQVVAPRDSFKVRVLDVSIVGGQPALAYAVWDASTSSQRASYKTKVLDGSTWTTPSWSLASGQPFGYEPEVHYLGGATFGRGGQLYTSRDANGTWIVQEWRWSSTTRSWTAYREIARSTRYKLVRPHVPLDRGPVDLLIQRVRRYDDFANYDIDILAY
jgi:BNR repeat-containing family member